MNDKALAVLEFDKVRRRLADHTSFSGGRTLALTLLPSSDAAEVKRRAVLASEAKNYGDRRGGPPFGGAHDMRPEVEAAARGKMLLPAELVDIADTLRCARTLRRALVRDAALCPGLAAIAEGLDECPALSDALAQTLDDEGGILDSASPALRRIRKTRRTAHDRLTRQMQALVASSSARPYLQEPLVTQRAGRYVVPVKSEFRAKVPGVVHDTSDSGATVFVEPLAVVELGNQYRELVAEEEHEVERILRELSALVGAEAQALTDTVAGLGELDLLFAVAEYGVALRAHHPQLTAGPPHLAFQRARHPLLDPETVVPIDIRVGDDFRVLVITGPNTGGKTVALKTVGLLVAMAQAGLPIPAAEDSRLATFADMFADIGDEQSIEQSLSTFSGHMTNIVAMLAGATSESLVLLDELGAGTDPEEGAALAVALLEALRMRGVATVASTHYSELKAYAHSTDGVANASVEFDLASLRPTYELTIGLPGRSNALAIAERLGLPGEILASARAGLDSQAASLEDLLAEVRAARGQAAEDRTAAAAARADADKWAQRLDKALADLEREREEVLNTARREAEAELRAVRTAIGRLEREAAAAGERGAAEELAALAGTAEAAAGGAAALVHEPAPAKVVSATPPEALEPGAIVRVAGLGQAGELLEVRADGTAEVAVGALRMVVGVDELELAPEATLASPAPRRPQASGARTAAGGPSPNAAGLTELDLRGVRVEDGLRLLDAHLDRAAMADAPWVTVIHGHGTGAMKDAVRSALRAHPQVRSSRPGEPGEGGDGVTVVTLK